MLHSLRMVKIMTH